MDNASANMAALRLVLLEFPWLIAMGYKTNFLDLLMEDLFCDIQEFVEMYNDVL